MRDAEEKRERSGSAPVPAVLATENRLGGAPRGECESWGCDCSQRCLSREERGSFATRERVSSVHLKPEVLLEKRKMCDAKKRE